MAQDLNATHITIKRPHHNLIEYSVTRCEPMMNPETRTYHANRTATFFGPHTGCGDARQIGGGASTLWRDDEIALLTAFKRAFPFASVDVA